MNRRHASYYHTSAGRDHAKAIAFTVALSFVVGAMLGCTVGLMI